MCGNCKNCTIDNAIYSKNCTADRAKYKKRLNKKGVTI